MKLVRRGRRKGLPRYLSARWVSSRGTSWGRTYRLLIEGPATIPVDNMTLKVGSSQKVLLEVGGSSLITRRLEGINEGDPVRLYYRNDRSAAWPSASCMKYVSSMSPRSKTTRIIDGGRVTRSRVVSYFYLKPRGGPVRNTSCRPRGTFVPVGLEIASDRSDDARAGLPSDSGDDG